MAKTIAMTFIIGAGILLFQMANSVFTQRAQQIATVMEFIK